ncbi:glycoside hydrolase family 19 protein [Yersinia enterocolitica]|uniref:glycoside hydrolase family 19 protein n=1 Tax=Yersinia enterocolitica TaxID=630 RepID=UPI003D055D33
MNISTFKRITELSDELSSRWFLPVYTAMQEFGITSGIDMAMYIAQVGHESGGFKHVVESFNYTPTALLNTFLTRISKQQAESLGRTSAHPAQQVAIANIVYGNRLGNKNVGDGWKYRGRGLIQITGADNYLLCGDALQLNLIKMPELLKEDIYASRSAAWFYTTKGCLRHGDDLIRITHLVNGGINGLDDRLTRFQRAREILSV